MFKEWRKLEDTFKLYILLTFFNKALNPHVNISISIYIYNRHFSLWFRWLLVDAGGCRWLLLFISVGIFKGTVSCKNHLSQFLSYLEFFWRREEKPSRLVNFSSCSKYILVLKKNTNEIPYDVIYSTNSVEEEYL